MAKEAVPNHLLPDVLPTSPEEAITELTRRGYETPAICSYAKAARSWCEKGSNAWNIWKSIETMTSSSK